MEKSIYCLKCKKFTENGPLETHVTKNGRAMVKSKCEVCGTKKNRFVSNKEIQGGGLGSLFADLLLMVKTLLPKIAKTVLPALGIAAASGAVQGATKKAVEGKGFNWSPYPFKY